MSIPDLVQFKLKEWIGEYQLLHSWEVEGTYFIVCVDLSGCINCVRIFPLDGQYHLVCDSCHDCTQL